MPVTGLQRDDLLRFGKEVARLQHLRLVIARNAGRLTDEQFKLMEDFITEPETIVVLLDGFEEHCHVDLALNELIPLPNQLRSNPQTANRVRAALRALQGGDG